MNTESCAPRIVAHMERLTEATRAFTESVKESAATFANMTTQLNAMLDCEVAKLSEYQKSIYYACVSDGDYKLTALKVARGFPKARSDWFR